MEKDISDEKYPPYTQKEVDELNALHTKGTLVRELHITEDELLADIASLIHQEHPGAGWYTTREIADAEGLPLKKTSNRLDCQHEKGTVEKLKVGNRVYWRRKQNG